MKSEKEIQIDQQIAVILQEIAQKEIVLKRLIDAKITYSPLKKGDKVLYADWFEKNTPIQHNGVIIDVHYSKTDRAFRYCVQPHTKGWIEHKSKNPVWIDTEGNKKGIIYPFKP